MSKFLVVFIVLLLIIGSIVGVAYYSVEKPAKVYENVSTATINIAIFDNETLKQISALMKLKAGYSDTIFAEANATDSNFILQNVPTNTTITAYYSKQGYYSEKRVYETYNVDTIRSIVYLEKIHNLSVKTTNYLVDSIRGAGIEINNTNIRLEMICFRWSTNVIKVLPENLSRVEIPARYSSKVDSCYKIDKNTKNIYLEIYSNLLQSTDNIVAYLIDADLDSNSGNIVVSNDKNEDIGNTDFRYIIN